MVTYLWKKKTTNFSQNHNKILWDILIVYVLSHIVPDDTHNTPIQTKTAKLCKKNQGFLYVWLGGTWTNY